MIEKNLGSILHIKILESRVEEAISSITRKEVEVGIINYSDDRYFQINHQTYLPFITLLKNKPHKEKFDEFFNNFWSKVFFYIEFRDRNISNEGLLGFYNFKTNVIMVLTDQNHSYSGLMEKVSCN